MINFTFFLVCMLYPRYGIWYMNSIKEFKNKKYLSLLLFSYSEIRLLFLIDGIAIRYHVCSY